MKLQYDRNQQSLIAYSDENKFMGEWECRDAFVPGYNEEGEPHESLPDGEYPNTWAEDKDTASQNGPAYGTFYIHTGDPRGRDIHGGGSGCDYPYDPRQGWCPTYGCLRMQNEDGEQLSDLMIEAGNNVPLEVIDG